MYSFIVSQQCIQHASTSVSMNTTAPNILYKSDLMCMCEVKVQWSAVNVKADKSNKGSHFIAYHFVIFYFFLFKNKVELPFFFWLNADLLHKKKIILQKSLCIIKVVSWTLYPTCQNMKLLGTLVQAIRQWNGLVFQKRCIVALPSLIYDWINYRYSHKIKHRKEKEMYWSFTYTVSRKILQYMYIKTIKC